jgi:hypothetical protein
MRLCLPSRDVIGARVDGVCCAAVSGRGADSAEGGGRCRLLVTGWLSPRERARRGWNTGGSGAANNNAVIIHACTIEEA